MELGFVRIEIIEASVEEVTLRGDIKGDQSLLRALGQKVASSETLRRDSLMRYILLISDLPGVSARSNLSPIAGEREAYALTIDISHDLVGGQLNFDNCGSKSVGVEMTQFQELQYGSVEYSHPLGAEGTVVSASACTMNPNRAACSPTAISIARAGNLPCRCDLH